MLGIEGRRAAADECPGHWCPRYNLGRRIGWRYHRAIQVGGDTAIEIEQAAHGDDLVLERIGLAPEHEFAGRVQASLIGPSKRHGKDRILGR